VIDCPIRHVETPQDANLFLRWSHGVFGIHPDDDYRDVIDFKTGERSFSDETADLVRAHMDSALRILGEEEVYRILFALSGHVVE
jgi:hypothetical protein